MATKKPGGLALDEKKGYVRSLGEVYTKGRYSQPRFYLGWDGAEAERRNLRLEQFWRCVKEKWARGPALQTTFMEDFVLWEKGERPHWNTLLLDAARAVAKGETTYFVPGPTARPIDERRRFRGEERYFPMFETEYAEYLALLNRDFPVVTFRAEDKEAYSKAQAIYASRFQEQHQEVRRIAGLLDDPVPEAPHERLHHALGAYIQELEKEAALSQWNRLKVNQARRLRRVRERHDDVP